MERLSVPAMLVKNCIEKHNNLVDEYAKDKTIKVDTSEYLTDVGILLRVIKEMVNKNGI